MSLYIGLMSGTSVDAVDAVLVDFAQSKPELLHTYSCPVPAGLRTELLELFTPGMNEIDRMGAAHRRLGYLYVEVVKQLLQQANVSPRQVAAIGNHGQTIRHRPRLELECAFTLQIGDNHFLAQLSSICVVGDFRSRDICVGGQGAPLVPGFHAAVFSSSTMHRSVLNIGGIANVTYLPTTGACVGFDTGPGNGLLDAWINHHQQLPFDRDGQWAASGAVDTELLTLLMAHPFLAMTPPKSTGKEEFTLDWLQRALFTLPAIEAKNVQRTLVEFTALSICDAIKRQCPLTQELYVCGGGVNNKLLWQRLSQLLKYPLFTTEKLGVAPQWVEAMAFAWLAKRCLDGLPGNVPSVTGAQQAVVLGAIYPAYPAD
ncbi:MAG TPA: anhydro-N-acetylmuramic acid kinase [Cellvibrionaceae bacterium]